MKILTVKGARCLAQSAHNHMRSLLQGVSTKTEQRLDNGSNISRDIEKSTRRLALSAADRTDTPHAASNTEEMGAAGCSGDAGYMDDENKSSMAECSSVYIEAGPTSLACSCDELHAVQDTCVLHSDSFPPAGPDQCSEAGSHKHTTLPTTTPIYKSKLNSFTLNSGNPSHDLKRFLDIVGTEPKEARYWFKYFQKMSNSNPLFAVIQIEEELVRASELIHRPSSGVYNLEVDSPLNELCSYLGFLHRHDMKCIVIYGRSVDGDTDRSGVEDLQNHIMQDGRLITDLLEKNGAQTRLLSIPPVQVTQTPSSAAWEISRIDPVTLEWAQQSGCIPVLSNIALTSTRQLINVDLFETTTAVSKTMLPLKVLIVNMEGGITDQDGKIIPNINLPHDEGAVLRSPWCTPQIQRKIHDVKGLLKSLHEEQIRLGRAPDSAVILTAASSLLTELFTHYGSGTFFKIVEKINMFKSFDDVDVKRLVDLIHVTFGKDLKENYIETTANNVETVFISEGYSAAVVITREPGMPVPYLDKFVVRKDHQDNAVGRMLWERVRHTYPQLFWRSRNTNLINPWYFKRSEGSWSDGEWTVFWYGVKKHKHTSELIDYALSKSNSFQAPDPSHLVVMKARSTSSPWSPLQYMKTSFT